MPLAIGATGASPAARRPRGAGPQGATWCPGGGSDEAAATAIVLLTESQVRPQRNLPRSILKHVLPIHTSFRSQTNRKPIQHRPVSIKGVGVLVSPLRMCGDRVPAWVASHFAARFWLATRLRTPVRRTRRSVCFLCVCFCVSMFVRARCKCTVVWRV